MKAIIGAKWIDIHRILTSPGFAGGEKLNIQSFETDAD
jgi:hypothetical protein